MLSSKWYKNQVFSVWTSAYCQEDMSFRSITISTMLENFSPASLVSNRQLRLHSQHSSEIRLHHFINLDFLLKDKKQYLLNFQVSSYCCLPLQGGICLMMTSQRSNTDQTVAGRWPGFPPCFSPWCGSPLAWSAFWPRTCHPGPRWFSCCGWSWGRRYPPRCWSYTRGLRAASSIDVWCRPVIRTPTSHCHQK